MLVQTGDLCCRLLPVADGLISPSNRGWQSWGHINMGGDSSAVSPLLTSGVQSITPNARAFAALKIDGTVVAWGGAGSIYSFGVQHSAVSSQLTSVVSIASTPTSYAFAALKSDGTVVCWGDPNSGGDTSSVAAQLTQVESVIGARNAFVAVKTDGSVVTWGLSFCERPELECRTMASGSAS